MHPNRIPKSWNGPVSQAPPPGGGRRALRPARGGRRATGLAAAAARPAAAPAAAQGKVRDFGRGAAAEVRVRLTGRGGILAVFAISFLGLLAASVSHAGALAGFSYAAACFLTACLVRRGHLLPVVVTAPMLFGIAVVGVQAMTATGGLLSVAGGTLVTLGNVAGWLFGGTGLALVIALARGLPGELRSLRASARGDTHS